MSISNVSSKVNISSNWAIVRSLDSWETRIWPSIWASLKIIALFKQNIFLLNSKPWLFLWFVIKNFFCIISEICVTRFQFFKRTIRPRKSLAQYHDIVSSSERIWEIENRLNNDLRALSSGLICGWSIIVPFWNISNRRNFSSKSSAFCSHSKSSINPNVLRNHVTSLVNVSEEIKLCFSWCINSFHLKFFNFYIDNLRIIFNLSTVLL